MVLIANSWHKKRKLLALNIFFVLTNQLTLRQADVRNVCYKNVGKTNKSKQETMNWFQRQTYAAKNIQENLSKTAKRIFAQTNSDLPKPNVSSVNCSHSFETDVWSFTVYIVLPYLSCSPYFPEKVQGGPKNMYHFIIALISHEINPGFCFPGKS